MNGPNRSHAVMSQRIEPKDSADWFPTPPWASRALCEHVLSPDLLKKQSVWESACGDGAMARPLAEYFRSVRASDAYDYGFGEVEDFLFPTPYQRGAYDWIITNPPFRLAEEFVRRGLEVASSVALLVRTVFLESVGRYALFQQHQPTVIAQFAERVPMVKGRLQRDASTATSYCWILWEPRVHEHRGHARTTFTWIPPCRARLDRAEDWNR